MAFTFAFSAGFPEIFVETAFGSAGGGVVPAGGGVVPAGGGVVSAGGVGVVPAGGVGVVSVLVVSDDFFEDELVLVFFEDETLVVGDVFFEDDALPFVVVVVFFEDDAPCVVVDFGDDVGLLVLIFGEEVFGAFAVIFGDFIVPGFALTASATDASATTSAATSINIRLMDMTLPRPISSQKGCRGTWKTQVP